jgi:hypothetical protein
LKKAAISVTPVSVTSTSPQVVKLVGEVAAHVTPAPEPHRQHGGTSTGQNAQRKRALRQGGSHSGHDRGAQSGRGARTSQPGRDSGGRPANSTRRAQQRSR